jgi:hypothetical protein
MGGWAAASVARWPKFQPKSSKWAGEKKKLAGRICGQIMQKRGQRKFLKEFPSWPNFIYVLSRK